MAEEQRITDPSMTAVRQRFESSKLSLDELGIRMGYPKESARKSAWQFLNATNDPRLSMLRKFAAAVKCSIRSLV
jgi:transcriptional regulator with XRE-family HTH domain